MDTKTSGPSMIQVIVLFSYLMRIQRTCGREG